MNRLIIFGPPGAGKGTQAGRIAESLGVPAISTGDIFRRNISEKTALGLEVEAVMARGEFVSDEITNAMVRDRLAQEDAAEGFLLDGYPRNTEQVAVLDAFLAEQGHQLDGVLMLHVPSDVAVDRILSRAAKEGRADDNEATAQNRVRIYERETFPLADIYAERGLLATVDGVGEVDDITRRLLDAISARSVN